MSIASNCRVSLVSCRHHLLEGLFAHLPKLAVLTPNSSAKSSLALLEGRDAGAPDLTAQQGALSEVVRVPKPQKLFQRSSLKRSLKSFKV